MALATGCTSALTVRHGSRIVRNRGRDAIGYRRRRSVRKRCIGDGGNRMAGLVVLHRWIGCLSRRRDGKQCGEAESGNKSHERRFSLNWDRGGRLKTILTRCVWRRFSLVGRFHSRLSQFSAEYTEVRFCRQNLPLEFPEFARQSRFALPTQYPRSERSTACFEKARISSRFFLASWKSVVRCFTRLFDRHRASVFAAGAACRESSGRSHQSSERRIRRLPDVGESKTLPTGFQR